MELSIWVPIAALAIAIWHEISSLPSLRRSIQKAQKQVYDLETENRSLQEIVYKLDDQLLTLSNEIEKIKDPAYYEAIADGDGDLIYEMDKSRGAT